MNFLDTNPPTFDVRQDPLPSLQPLTRGGQGRAAPTEQTDPLLFVGVAALCVPLSAWWFVRMAWRHPVATMCGVAGGIILGSVIVRGM